MLLGALFVHRWNARRKFAAPRIREMCIPICISVMKRYKSITGLSAFV
jgi:hypothetical protein